MATQDFKGTIGNVKPLSDSDQRVSLTGAGSGSSGIMVDDSANIKFGASGSFALIVKCALPDWTPAGSAYLLYKYWSNGIILEPLSNGKIQLRLFGATATRTVNSGTSPGFVDGSEPEITAVVTVGATNTTIDFYFDGVPFGAQQTVVNAGSCDDTRALHILGSSSGHRIEGKVHHVYILNFAPTPQEVLDINKYGIPLKWIDPTGASPASQIAQTSGTLVVGKEYMIDDWITDDDFTNVGGANVDGTRFVATGTTPTKWTNSSSLRRIGATLYLPSRAWQPDRPIDCSGNALVATYPSVGWGLTQPFSYATLQAAANNAGAGGLTIPVPVGGLYRTNADPSVICVRTA
jgi:hypothetical protein